MSGHVVEVNLGKYLVSSVQVVDNLVYLGGLDRVSVLALCDEGIELLCFQELGDECLIKAFH